MIREVTFFYEAGRPAMAYRLIASLVTSASCGRRSLVAKRPGVG